MIKQVSVYDPTANDPLSKVRGVGRYVQIIRENFPKWKFVNNLAIGQYNHSIFINPFFNFLQPPPILKRIAHKQIAVIHDLIPLKYPGYFPAGIKGRLNIFLNRLALRHYDLIITDSHTSKRDIVKILKIKENKVRVVYPCLPKIFLAPEGSGGSKATEQYDNLTIPNQYCLYVGDATWNKNLVNLAKAVKEINVTSVFVGKIFNQAIQQQDNVAGKKLLNHPWQREFKEFLQETKDDKRFIFLGFVPDEKLIQLYRRAACNILISRDEGFGFSYLEAASQACPTLLSDIQVLRETSKNKGVLFAKPAQTVDIANTLGEVYFNQELRNKLGRESRERVRFFSPKKFVSDFTKILTL